MNLKDGSSVVADLTTTGRKTGQPPRGGAPVYAFHHCFLLLHALLHYLLPLLVPRRGIFFIAAGRKTAEQAGEDHHIDVSFHVASLYRCYSKIVISNRREDASCAPIGKVFSFFFRSHLLS